MTMVAGILFALLLQHALGLRVSRLDSRMALSSARDSYYFGSWRIHCSSLKLKVIF